MNMKLCNLVYINISIVCMHMFAHLLTNTDFSTLTVWSSILFFPSSILFPTLYIKNMLISSKYTLLNSFLIAICPFSKVCRPEFIVRILCQVLELQIGHTRFVLKEQALPMSEKLIRQNRQLITSY